MPAPTAPAHAQAPVSPAAKLALVASDIKLAHSVFALPFAVLGAFLARPADAPASRFAGQLALVVLCMVFARTWAMLVNRLADVRFDAANPRTQRRLFAAGRMSIREGWAFALGSAALFIAAAALFRLFFANPWPLLLSVPVLAWIAFYSFTKRFTALCHVFLGGALAASPVAAAIAVDPHALAATPSIWFIAGMVLVWVAGFDVIYALQDLDFDRSAGLSSIPARLGWRGSIWVSRALHAVALAMLLLARRADARLDHLFATGIAIVAALLLTEHAVLARRGRDGIPMAFFTYNGIVSCVLGVLGCIDVVA